jgi:hypothetical protein
MRRDHALDDTLYEFASERQKEYLDAIKLHGGAEAAARNLGLSCGGTIRKSISRLKAKAAMRGHSPDHDMTRTVPEPFVVRGVSTYYDKDGKAAGQWVKSRLDDQRYFELIRATAEALSEDIRPTAPVELPESLSFARNLLTTYILTDVHLGMLAWHEEGGANWNLKIAEKTIEGCFDLMVKLSPDSETAIISQLGDWFHFDGILPVTPTSRHVLDADTRFAKVIRAGFRLLRRLIGRALEKHQKVVVLMAEGNHDESSSQWLQVMLDTLYENEPRVEVIVSAKPYYAYEFDQTALFFHHGHKKRGQNLALLLAAEFREIWGRTKKAYGHTGHLHHELEQAFPGIKMIQHPTLSARDAHASREGFMSERQASVITYSRKFGEIGRHVVTPDMLG